jgi:hypothetical protein
VRTDTIKTVACGALLAMLTACGASRPHTFGSYDALSPRITPKEGERTPQHVTVELARPANVAVFLVVPGRGSQLLFPADSTQSGYIEAGSHTVETSLARLALGSDSSRLMRRPGDPPVPAGQRPTGARGRTGRDSLSAFGAGIRGYLLVYASQAPLPYSTLYTRVHGISIPIEDDDALNTVTKLIRETTRTTGPWAAYATDFPP